MFAFFLLSTFFITSQCKKAEESSTGALLKFDSYSQQLNNMEFEVAPAHFGYHNYGGSLEGYLILPMNTTYHKGCASEPEDSNPYIHWILDWDAQPRSWILVVDRGDCYFVNKVYNAQLIGASAVIILDTRVEPLLTMWEPAGYSNYITIPSVLLNHTASLILMDQLGVKNYNGTYFADTIYPSPIEMNWTIGILEWGLPHFDDRVEWELWTSSYDQDTIAFKKNFKNASIELSVNNDTIFTPRYYVLDGTSYGCKNNLRCTTQCTNNGRYCYFDPDGSINQGVSGMDIVQEDLRQICLWEYIQGEGLGQAYWWDYSILWNIYCYNGTLIASTFNANCSYTQMIKLNSSLQLGVQKCINDSGGYGYTDGANSLLDRELRLRDNSSIYSVPTVIVNEFLIQGQIDCNVITTQQCQVLDAICAGFVNGTAPEICYVTPAPTPVTCQDYYRDCAGVCYGNYKNDSCGQCLDISSTEWNSCIGCDGVAYSNKTYDCKGTCGGNYAINDCGYCILHNLTNFSSYGQDCSGTCNGNKKYDRCNKCLSENDELFDSCIGCDNIPFSGTKVNPCGYCMLANLTNFQTYGQDCSGTCNGNKVFDRCGQCLLEDNTSFDSCVGCDDEPNSGKEINPCGFCMNSKQSNFSTWGLDCRNVCDITGLYQLDKCGQCLQLSNASWDSCVGCDGVPYSNTTWICGICAAGDTYEYIHACDNSTTQVSSSDHSIMTMTTILIVISIVAFVIVVLIAYIIYRLWKRQREVNSNFQSILQTYQMMDERKSDKKSKGKKQKNGSEMIANDDDEHDQQVI